MTKLVKMLLACFIAVMFIAAPLAASARTKDKANSGFCKSGFHANNVKNCKENGGKK